jgi:tripeptide aminopeptidase
VEPGRGINPVLEGDTLRSDGTTILGGDCKAGLAIVLEALACVVESDRPHRAVEVAFSRHEEGGLVGVHHMDFSLLTARTGIVLDGEGPPNRITLSAPSQNVVTAEIIGRAAHAGLEPENGLSALLVTAEILTRLPLGRIDAETTANIGWLEGGLKRNIVPERALLDGEFRSRSNDKLAWLEGQFRKVFGEAGSRYPDARISLDIRNTYQAYRVEPQHETVATIGHALDRLGLSPVMEASGGGSDANVFIERGITALPVGIGVRSFHTTWETALITEVLQGAEMCQAAILAVNGN